MKKLFLAITALMTAMVVQAQESIKVSVAFNGATATVSIPDGASGYVSCTSGTSSHVVLVQSELVGETTSGEITYTLSGTSEDGGFYLDGKYKATIELNDLTLTNPSGPAINIQDGKRIKIEIKKGTTNTLADGKDKNYNGCIHCEGHLELKKTGTLNVTGNYKHAIYSKEYLQIAKPTVNILGAKKDGIHCKQYFWMEDDCKLTISGVEDDGVQVEVDDRTAYTGALSGHEGVDDNGEEIDENSGAFYQDAGTLTINECGGKAIKADGDVVFNGGKQTVDANAIEKNLYDPATSISTPRNNDVKTEGEVIFNLTGRQMLKDLRKGQIVIIRKDNEFRKVIIK